MCSLFRKLNCVRLFPFFSGKTQQRHSNTLKMWQNNLTMHWEYNATMIAYKRRRFLRKIQLCKADESHLVGVRFDFIIMDARNG